MKSIVRDQADNIKHRHTVVTQQIVTAIPMIKADSQQIAYALKQLVDNALAAVDENGRIDIQLNTLNCEAPHERCGVHMLKNYVVITVSDNGKGMATSTQAQIFDPFFTGNEGQARTGLGLAAAAGIIKSHGGYIQLRSQQGKGTAFKIYLPIQEMA